ncbi:glycosyltransferase [Methylacidiphilum kamchatkense]|nr:glycosyltransferase [Methylacidiphilum kamchatkense]
MACLDQSKALASLRHQITIYTTNDNVDSLSDIPLKQPINKDGYQIYFFPLTYAFIAPLRKYYFSIPLMQALHNTISLFDLVYIFSLYRFPPTIAALYARSFRVPYIMNPHGFLYPFLFRKNRLLKLPHELFFDFPNLHHASAIHYTSQEEKELVSPLKIKSPGIIIPLGIKIEEYQHTHKGKFRILHPYLLRQKILLFMGRINFKKGLDLLIPSFARIIQEYNNILFIAGPDNEGYGKKVSAWVKQYNLEKKVIFTGMVTGDQKIALLSDADIFILPSYTENFGIAVVEALAMGTPVIISNKVNIWREIRDADAGIVVSCNVEEITKACLDLLKDDTRRNAMGANGRKLVEKCFVIEKTAKMLEKHFMQLINSNKSHKNKPSDATQKMPSATSI